MIRAVTSCATQVSPAPTMYTASAAMLARPSGWPRPPLTNMALMTGATIPGAKPPLSVSPVAAASISIGRRLELRGIWLLGRCATLQQGIDRIDLLLPELRLSHD